VKPAPIVVVGAGAAGLMAAIHAAGPAGAALRHVNDGAAARRDNGGAGARRDEPGAASHVVVLESTRDGGRKILISGGGRCNVLPGELDESRFVTDSSPNTMKKMLRSWPLAEQRHFFEEELGVPLALERESGKLFPRSNRARDVRDALVAAARVRGVELVFETTLASLEPVTPGTATTGAMPAFGTLAPRWRLTTSDGASFEAGAVVLATGGLSVPKTGSDGAGLLVARSLGLAVNETYAALTPLTCEPPRFGELAGVSLDVSVHAPGAGLRSRGGFLFTHRGYSGPAVLDVSHLAVRSASRPARRELPREAASAGRQDARPERQKLLVQWTDLDREAWQKELAPRRAGALGVVRTRMPTRLAERLLREAGVPEHRTLAELRSDERRRLLDALTQFELPWTGHEGYRTAEVTGGGIDLGEVDPRTMESRRHPGLFVCGEMLDAFGPIGGYNFAWAWATGRAAGLGARRSVLE
jgi:predicted Rossmann fold flavoprotein